MVLFIPKISEVFKNLELMPHIHAKNYLTQIFQIMRIMLNDIKRVWHISKYDNTDTGACYSSSISNFLSLYP